MQPESCHKAINHFFFIATRRHFFVATVSMIAKYEFDLQKTDLIQCYEEYIDMLETFGFHNVENLKKLDKLSKLNARLLKCDTECTQAMTKVKTE